MWKEQSFWKASTNSQLTWLINAQAPQGKGQGLGSSSRLYFYSQVCLAILFLLLLFIIRDNVSVSTHSHGKSVLPATAVLEKWRADRSRLHTSPKISRKQ